MTDEELEMFDRLIREASSDEERERIRAQWLPHMARCLMSTNRHVKELEKRIGSIGEGISGVRSELSEGLDSIRMKMDHLHSTPKWKEDKMGWLIANWLQVVVAIYLLKSFGLDVAPLLATLFGGN